MKPIVAHNLNNALFEAIRNDDLKAVAKLLKRGVDIESVENNLTPLFLAVQQGHENIVRFLLQNSANIGQDVSDILKIIGTAGPALIRAIDCYDGNSRINLAQEGLDYDQQTLKLERDQRDKLVNIQQDLDGPQKIPTISHHIYFTSSDSPSAIDSLSLNKTLSTLHNLDNITNWQHYFWTNNPEVIPAAITSLSNVALHLIDEMQDFLLYPELIQILAQAANKADFVTASDIARIMVLSYGGVYFDLDYEVYRADKLLPLMQAFHFVGGKEAAESNTQEIRLIGNSILAASPKHPIIKAAMELVKRNFDLAQPEQIPEYIQKPCSQASAVAYKSGGPVISTAYYLAANNGTNDVVLPNSILYNYLYAWSITPESRCHRPDMTVNLDQEAIGADMFCGGWTAGKMIYYPENLGEYLFTSSLLGYTRIAEYFLNEGADINTLNKNAVTPLYAAAHNGHTDTVKMLLDRGADIEAKTSGGATSLYIAAQHGHVETINLLLEYGANENIAPTVNLAQIALANGHVEAAKLLTNNDQPDCYAGETKAIFAQEAINYYSSNRKLMLDSSYKLNHLSEYVGEDFKIPQITHQIYFSSQNSPKAIDELALNISLRTLTRLNELSNNWQHYIWTNDARIILEQLRNIHNVEIHLINELSETKLYQELILMLQQAENDQAIFAGASDITRMIVLQKFGGSYRDLDYEIYRPERFVELMKGFNFLGGKEFTHEPVFMGNAAISASSAHPIINTAIDLLKRNFDHINIPNYVKFPCNKVFKLIYETGPAVITMAIHHSANQNGNIDLIMPSYHLFNMDYANYLNPASLCHIPGRNLSLDMYKDTIGADLFCGSWHKLKDYENRIYYPHELYAAVRSGNRKTVKLMLEQNVTIENGLEFSTIEENIMEILLVGVGRSVLFLGCYDGNQENTFASQGINYQEANQALIAETLFKRSHLDDYHRDMQKIPTITHQIYFANPNSLQLMDSISQQKTIINAERLNALEEVTWRHIIWTNDKSLIPANILNITNIEVHLIDELAASILYPNLIELLTQSSQHKKMLVAVSDVARLMALKTYGGIYHDLDYEIFRAAKLLELTQAFNFIAGKEGTENGNKLTLIGNSIIAASADHPIINKATEISFYNMNGQGYEYSQYPCGKASELVFKAGGPIITMAYFLAANQENNVDIVMPNSVFYDFAYIRAQTPASRCHVPGRQATLGPDAIGADMFCGSWHENSGFENLNYFAKNDNAYLFESAIHGYTRFVEFFINKGADVNAVGRLGANPLYMAVQNGHRSTVVSLLKHEADVNVFAINGLTPLCNATAKGNKDFVALLLKHDAIVDLKCNGENAIQIAAKNDDMDMVKLLINGVEMFCRQNNSFTEFCGRDADVF